MSEQNSNLSLSIKTLDKLFAYYPDMAIPNYQRPYRWKKKNVTQLLDDLFYFFDKNPDNRYRLGSLVFHKDNNNTHNIVDGQQRIITLLIICHALEINATTEKKLLNDHQFDTESAANISSNYQTIQNYLQAKPERAEFKNWLLTQCEFVIFILSDLSEAFQFFDSQNARGKALYPHDLLKAFHLRACDKLESEEKREIVNNWEQQESKNIEDIFAVYLFNIKNWANKNHAYLMTKDDLDHFKGLDVDELTQYPYADSGSYQYRMMTYFKQNWGIAKDHYSFQVDDLMINGRYFFEYTTHYLKRIENFIEQSQSGHTQENHYFIALTFNNSKDYRSGDKLVRYLFLSVLIYYVDKFGQHHNDEFTEMAFRWAYAARVLNHRLSLSSINKYVLHADNNLFWIIKNANRPDQVLQAKNELGYHQQLIKSKNELFKNNDDRILKIFDIKKENNKNDE